MSERKIFNYDSKILIDETYEKFGYYPDQYGRTSSKFVIAICRFCGEKIEVRKGFFNKSGSACHKKCKIEEMKQQKSPFSDPEIRKKAQEKIEEKYGKDREEINKKISDSRKTEKCKEKIKKTNLEKYGVENVFQADSVKEKIKETHKRNYGVDHPMKSSLIKEKTRRTIQEKYGVDNVMQNEKIREKVENTNLLKYGFSHPMQNQEIKEKAQKTNQEKYGVKSPIQNADINRKIIETNIKKYGSNSPFGNNKLREKIKANNILKFGFPNPMQNIEVQKKLIETIRKNENGNYDRVNLLRNNENFWDDLQYETISFLSKKYGIKYSSLTRGLNDDEFKKTYQITYSYPKIQKQKEVYEQIKILNKICVLNSRKEIYPYELDIYIPSSKFAIEFNGDFWHSEAWIQNKRLAKYKHIQKTHRCQEKGIRLFHIFEHQWDSRSKQILGFIRTILGKNEIKVPARKCLITHDDAKNFIDDNHIQGSTNSTIKYFNLEYKGEIVGSMTAAKHHRQNSDENDIVLSRLCFKDNTNVQGGSGKLFKSFVQWAKEEGYEKIISWSDNCWTEGNIYKVLGFTMDKEYGPDHFYWDINNHRYFSKQSQKKSSVNCPEGMTEREWCMERGLYRIWDCGKKRWIFDLKE
jgi:hypothetical protein